MKNLFAIVFFALAIASASVLCQEIKHENGFFAALGRLRSLISSRVAVQPNRYVEIIIDDENDDNTKNVKVDRASKLRPEVGHKSINDILQFVGPAVLKQEKPNNLNDKVKFIGPAIMKLKESKKNLRKAQYPGDDDDDDDDDYWDDEDDYWGDDDDDYDDDDADYWGDDDDYWNDYDGGWGDDDDFDKVSKKKNSKKSINPSVLTMSEELAQKQINGESIEKASHKKQRSKSLEEFDEPAKKADNFADKKDKKSKKEKTIGEARRHLGSGEVLYDGRHNSHVYGQDDFNCPSNQDGHYLNLNNCKRYYVCSGGRKTIIACHNGFSFDVRSKKCLPESIARC